MLTTHVAAERSEGTDVGRVGEALRSCVIREVRSGLAASSGAERPRPMTSSSGSRSTVSFVVAASASEVPSARG